jgi:hypothetical protein
MVTFFQNLDPSGGSSSIDLVDKKLDDGLLSLEFLPDELGAYTIHLYPDKKSEPFSFNTFQVQVYGSSSLRVKADSEAIVGKTFTFIGIFFNLILGIKMRRLDFYFILFMK